jgi:hypothetical protein
MRPPRPRHAESELAVGHDARTGLALGRPRSRGGRDAPTFDAEELR